MADVRLWANRPLEELWSVLQEEAEHLDGGWAARRFTGGAVVFLRRVDGRGELRIARAEKPKTRSGPALFVAECNTYLTSFGILDWRRVEEPEAPGIALRFLEPPRCPDCGGPMDPNALLYGKGACSRCALAATTKRMTKCADCGEPIPFDPVYDPDRCNMCAGLYGQRYAAELRARKEPQHV